MRSLSNASSASSRARSPDVAATPPTRNARSALRKRSSTSANDSTSSRSWFGNSTTRIAEIGPNERNQLVKPLADLFDLLLKPVQRVAHLLLRRSAAEI